MRASDICSKLIHSGAVSGFQPADFIDLAPMLWSRPPHHGWLSSAAGICLRDALEQNVYIAETPDKRRQRQLFSHVRIAIPATVYTSLETRFPGDFPANIEAELEALHQEDLQGVQQHNCSVRYRIEPDTDLPDDTVRYRFGVAIYVRGRGEKAQWHVRFGPQGQTLDDNRVIPLHKDETAVLIGPDLYQSSYAFRDWPLSPDVRLLISHRRQPEGARVALRAVCGIPEGGIEVHQDGWSITDHQGNQVEMGYTAAPCAEYMAESHTQMDSQAEHTVYFRAQRGQPQQPHMEPGAVADTVAETIAALQAPQMHHRTEQDRRPHKAQKPSGLLIRGIALQRDALILDADGERRLLLEHLMMGNDSKCCQGLSLLIDSADQLRIEHRGQSALLSGDRPIMLPGLKVPLYPSPESLREDYLGWLPLTKALLLSELNGESIVQLDTRVINQALALHCRLMPPQPQGLLKPTSPIAAQVQQKGDQIAIRTGAQGSSYLLPQRQNSKTAARGHCLPPLTTVVRDKAAAFTLICSQYVLEYCPPGDGGYREAG